MIFQRICSPAGFATYSFYLDMTMQRPLKDNRTKTMKKTVLLTALALCAGCSQNSDNSKIQALSLKIDMDLSNQAAIGARLDTMPTIRQLDSMSYYYHTNSLNSLYAESDKIMKQNVELASLGAQISGLVLTNVLTLEAGQEELRESVQEGNQYLSGSLFILTNGTMLDVSFTRLKIDDVGQDVRAIKAKLGVFN